LNLLLFFSVKEFIIFCISSSDIFLFCDVFISSILLNNSSFSLFVNNNENFIIIDIESYKSIISFSSFLKNNINDDGIKKFSSFAYLVKI
jgi:uncharacterized membrane protein